MKELLQTRKIKQAGWKKEYVILLILIIAVLWRIAAACTHFTHYDDIGLIVSILQSGDRIWDKLHYNSVIHWTYAPLQCWMIGLLVDASYSYEVNLFLGRMPSLVFSILNIFLVYHFYKKKYKDERDFYEKAVAVFMISISWELVIYAAQSEPYSIGLTGLLFLMLEFQNIAQKKEIKEIRLILIGAVVGYMQYQLFIFVFCFFIAVFCVVWKEKEKLIRSVLCSMGSLLLELPVIKDFLESGMLERGTNWNVGNNCRFLFQSDAFRGFEKVTYMFEFFTENLMIWFRSMFVYKDSIWYTDLLAVCLIVLVLMGVLYEIRTRNTLSIFLMLSVCFHVVLILDGKLAFSPSRHTMIFIPIVIYYIAASVKFLQGMQIGNLLLRFGCLVYAAILILTGVTFCTEWKLRKNRISTEVLETWIMEENPIFIGSYDGVMDLELMRLVGYEQAFAGKWKSGETLQTGDVMILFSRSKVTEQTEHALLDGYLNGKKFERMKVVEIDSDTEIEYAHGVFFNLGNGFYKYSYRVID